LVAATTRTSTGIACVPPTRVSSRSSSTRSSFTCVLGGISPISSRNSVPPSASSKRPSRRSAAPVKAPFSWPNSSLSSNVSGSAPTFTAMNGLLRRGLSLWIARATSSLPVPLSPSISTVLVTGASCSTFTSTSRTGALSPTSPVSRLSRSRSSSRRTSAASSSGGTGLATTSA